MTEITESQTCPYCQSVIEDCHAEWEYESENEVKCDSCDKVYISKPQYSFEGWRVEKTCDTCDEWTDNGVYTCECND